MVLFPAQVLTSRPLFRVTEAAAVVGRAVGWMPLVFQSRRRCPLRMDIAFYVFFLD